MKEFCEMLRKVFTEHPRSVGESYGEHARMAVGFGAAMVGGGLKCLVHALIPELFKTSGSDAVRKLYRDMVTNRSRDGQSL